MTLEAITPGDLTAMYRDLLAGGGRNGRALAPKTVRHVHTTLRKALGDAVDARHIAFNPAASAKAPKVSRGTDPNAWTPEQLAKFLASTEADRARSLWVLTASTGMRRSEALGLRWSDVDLDGGSLTIRQVFVAYGTVRAMKEPKTATSRRTLPLSERVVIELRATRRQQTEERLAAGPAWSDSDLVFTDEIGRPLDPPTVSAAFKRAVKASGLPPLPLHGLRHTFATIGLDAGVDVLYVAEMLGHSSPAITMSVYQHVRRDRLNAAMAQIAEAIEG